MYRVTQENYGDQFSLIKTCVIHLGQRQLSCALYKGELNGVTVYAIGNEASVPPSAALWLRG